MDPFGLIDPDNSSDSSVIINEISNKDCNAHFLQDMSETRFLHGWNEIWSALVVNAVTFSLMLTAFVILGRFSTVMSQALAPMAEEDAERSFKAWLMPAFCQVSSRYPVSFDGQVLIRFCVLGMKFCLFGTLVGSILIPIYMNSQGGELNFLQTTTANLDGLEWKIWLVVAASYALVLVFCLLMHQEWYTFTELQRSYYMKKAQDLSFSSSDTSGPDAQALYSLLIERVPRQIVTDNQLHNLFERLFEDGVHSCRLQMDLHALHNKQLLTEDLCCCCCCPRLKRGYAQSVEHVIRLERELARRLRGVQLALAENRFTVDAPATSTAFLTFNSLLSRQIALHQVALFHTRSNDFSLKDWIIRPAPEARDIVWRNVSIPLTFVQWRSRVFHVLIFMGVIFWSAPVVALNTVASAEFLRVHVPSITHIEEQYPFFFSLVTGYLPLLAVNTMMLLLPYALEWLTIHFEGRKQKSLIARKVLVRNFALQLATYFVLAIGAGLTESFQYFSLVASRPFCAFTVMGQMVPVVSVRFVVILMNKIGLTLPFVVMRVQSFCAGCFNIWADDPVYCWFGYEGTNLAIVLVIANMYAVIAPVVMPLCLFYFAVAACSYRWVFQRAYGRKLDPQHDSEGCCVAQEFDCCGAFWFELFGSAMGGLLVGVVSVTGVLTLQLLGAKPKNKFSYVDLAPAYAMIALAPMILYFWYRCNRTFMAFANVMPYEDAVTVSKYTLSEQVVSKFDSNYFRDPLLKIDLQPPELLSSTDSETSDLEASNLSAGDSEESKAFTISEADSDEREHVGPSPSTVSGYVRSRHHLGRNAFSW